jgi:hypothetical protein
LWQFYIQLVEIEATSKTMKDDLNLRPISINANSASRRHATRRLNPLAPGLTMRTSCV